MTDEKPLLAVLHGAVKERPPFWLMRQAGRYLPEFREMRRRKGGFLDLCYDPKAAAEVTLQPLRRFGMDGAILFSDILVLPHALGMSLDFLDGEGPVLGRLEGESDLDGLDPAGIEIRLQPVYETLELLSSALKREFPSCTLLGFAGAPWTIASYMLEGRGSRDYAIAKNWLFQKPELFEKLIALLVRTTSEYLIRQIDAGADAVQIFDSWAGALPGMEVRRYSLAPMAEIARAVQLARPGVPVLVFPRGVGAALAEFAAEPAFAALSLDTGMDPKWARQVIDGRCAAQGNLDPEALVAGGDALERHVAAIREAFSGHRHVFNLGHGVVPRTPVAHVEHLTKLLRA